MLLWRSYKGYLLPIPTMSLSTARTSTYVYALMMAGIEGGYLHADYYDEVVEGLRARYQWEAEDSLDAMRSAFVAMFVEHPAATERILDFLCEGDYLAVEFTARRYLDKRSPPQRKLGACATLCPAA